MFKSLNKQTAKEKLEATNVAHLFVELVFGLQRALQVLPTFMDLQNTKSRYNQNKSDAQKIQINGC